MEQQWISVKDRLPEGQGFFNVVVRTDGKNSPEVHSCWFHSDEWCFDSDMCPAEPLFTHSWFAEVTHWMPLPEPPKD